MVVQTLFNGWRRILFERFESFERIEYVTDFLTFLTSLPFLTSESTDRNDKEAERNVATPSASETNKTVNEEKY